MLHPSFSELLASVEEKSHAEGGESMIDSRYSVVIATAKRARQLTEQGVGSVGDDRKALSVAVEELYDYDLRILGTGDDEDEEEAEVESEESPEEEPEDFEEEPEE